LRDKKLELVTKKNSITQWRARASPRRALVAIAEAGTLREFRRAGGWAAPIG